MTDEPGTIYLLHASRPYVGTPSAPGKKIQTASHYLGWAKQLKLRIEHHRDGSGGNLTRVWKENGITFEVVRTWKGTRSDERTLHNLKDNKSLCPLCDPRAALHMKEIPHAASPAGQCAADVPLRSDGAHPPF